MCDSYSASGRARASLRKSLAVKYPSCEKTRINLRSANANRVLPSEAASQAEEGISRVQRRTRPRRIPRSAGESAGPRDDALLFPTANELESERW
jgi:hypothetical protein